MNKLYQHRVAFRFRRFACKAYSAFCSLHREVTIGTVRHHVADKEMLKAGRAVALMLLLATAHTPATADDTSPDIGGEELALIDSIHSQLTLQEVQVLSSYPPTPSAFSSLIRGTVTHDEIAALPVQTVADILYYIPGVDVRTRGASGAQADVSMRGGTFDQVQIRLNGVNITDAQTGHYSLNLPVSVDLIEQIEVQEDGINIVTEKEGNPLLRPAGTSPVSLPARGTIASRAGEELGVQGSLRLTAGMNGLVNPAATVRVQRGGWYLNASAEYNRTDGYYAPAPSVKEQKALDNSDLKLANIFIQTGCKDLDVQLGAQYKDAGAGMFYGFGSQDQFDATRTAFGAARYTHTWLDRWHLEADASYRANYDRYEWHRGQRLYGNFHFTQTATASLKGSVRYPVGTGRGTTAAGIEMRNENIRSTNLGDTVNPGGQVPNVPGFALSDLRVLDLVRGANRLDIRYSVSQSFAWNGLNAMLSVAGTYNSMFAHHISGNAHLRYRYARDGYAYLQADRSLRMPTFTDLYYDAGNQLGNKHLQPEEAWTLSAGTSYEHSFGSPSKAGGGSIPRLYLNANAFYRWGRNIIDWVYTPLDTRRPYHAQNHNRVDAAGFDLTAGFTLRPWLRRAEISYAYTWLDLDLNKSGSRYLDYLSHKVVARVEHGIAKVIRQSWIGAAWTLTWQRREGQYNTAEGEVANFTPVLLLDGQLFWEHPSVKVAVDCTNLTNRHYYDYGGILRPGAWAKLTITVKIHSLARGLQ